MRKHYFLFMMVMCFCISFQAQNVAFLKTGATGNGLSPESPTGSINAAYSILEENKAEGTIVLVGAFTLPTFGKQQNDATKRNKITFTSVWNGVDYREGNADCGIKIGNAGIRFVLNRSHVFENMRFINGGTTNTTPYILMVCNYNPVTIGEGVEVVNFPGKDVVHSVTIVAGYQNGQKDYTDATNTHPTATNKDASIIIKSGKFVIVGFNRDLNATYTGTANIDIQGGEITGLYGGSIYYGLGGNLNLSVSGGTFSGPIYAGNRPFNNINNAAGNTTVTISGGDFTGCPAILGEMTGSSKIDLSTLSTTNFNLIRRRCYGFDEINSGSGWSNFYSPKEVFASGTFTSSTSTTLPYRIYLPEGYNAASEYPLILWLHDEGSAGTDNEKQIISQCSSLVSLILNNENKCIILAPQRPAETKWLANDIYPGGASYSTDNLMSPYLASAKELLDNVIDTAAVNPNRIYIGGSSEGAGAAFDLMSRFPHLFAAGIPRVGCSDASNVAVIVDSLKNTPIWTFHGATDATLSVEGTRGLVSAIQIAGGRKIQYTEFPDLGHEIWWEATAVEGLTEWLFAQEKMGGATTMLGKQSFNEEVIGTEYYNLQGQTVNSPKSGTYIMKKRYASGNSEIKKIIKTN